jgi:hypothetical protein
MNTDKPYIHDEELSYYLTGFLEGSIILLR